MSVRNPKRFKSVKERVYGRWKEDVTTPQLRGKIGYDDSLRMLINLCMHCSPEEFPTFVHRLYYSWPSAYHDTELDKAVEECTEEFEYSTPIMNCGVPVRSNILPEMKEVVKETNWNMLFQELVNCAHRRHLLIPAERVEIVTEEE